VPAFNWIRRDWQELDNMEDWVNLRHWYGKFKMICMQTDWANEPAGAKISVCKFLHRTSGANVQNVQKDLFAHLKPRCRSSSLVVVLHHVILQLCQSLNSGLRLWCSTSAIVFPS
jgi:hypothetical protein